jgi:signal transduction histidine kinase
MTLLNRTIEMLLDRDPDAARDQLKALRELQREALAEMRALIFELRPGNLEQDGLVRALKTHASALQGRLGLPIVVESDLADRLPLPAEEVVYRIAQEALHNVVKHAAAHQVRVDVRAEGAGVRLRVEDDGKGFDPARVPDGHLGLAGMRARAERVGAAFSVDSAPGKGTTIELALGPPVLADLAAAEGMRATQEVPSIRDG